MENLIIQLIAGAVGGNAAGSAMPDKSLGGLGNSIAGAVGGGVLGQIIALVLPALSGSGLDIGSIISDVVGGGVGGAVLTALVGMAKKSMAG